MLDVDDPRDEDALMQEYLLGSHIPELPGNALENYAPGEAATMDIVGAARRVLHQALRERTPPPPMLVVPVTSDAKADSGVLVDVLGDGFPLLASLYERFDSITPSEKVVAVSDDAGYDEFVRTRPFLELDRRVRELRSVVEQHARQRKHTGKAPNMSAWDAILGEAQDIAAASAGDDNMIPLKLAPWANGKIQCWREGDLICCSLRASDRKGNKGIVMSSTPIEDHADDVARYVANSGVNPVDILGMTTHLACMLGGGGLATQLAQATPQLLAAHVAARAPVTTHKIVAATDPSIAAIMGLCHMAQSGNRQAAQEWRDLADAAQDDEELAGAIADGTNRLVVGLARKARRR